MAGASTVSPSLTSAQGQQPGAAPPSGGGAMGIMPGETAGMPTDMYNQMLARTPMGRINSILEAIIQRRANRPPITVPGSDPGTGGTPPIVGTGPNFPVHAGGVWGPVIEEMMRQKMEKKDPRYPGIPGAPSRGPNADPLVGSSASSNTRLMP